MVDNENGFHEILRLVFEPLGFNVEFAFDGEEGLRRFTSQSYDIVFSDVHMPKMGGPELFDHIRKIKPSQPIVMMTSGSDSVGRFELEVVSKKATACIYKPFEIEEAIKAAEHVLEIKLEENA